MPGHAERPSGYYAWLAQPESARTVEDRRPLGQIKQAWLASGCVYGYRKVQDDLRGLCERCDKDRVERLMHDHGIKAQVGYKKQPGMKRDAPSIVAPYQLQ